MELVNKILGGSGYGDDSERSMKRRTLLILGSNDWSDKLKLTGQANSQDVQLNLCTKMQGKHTIVNNMSHTGTHLRIR